MTRRLLATERRVPPEREGEYRDLWEQLARSVEDAGGHAWVFRGEEEGERLVEFIEYAGDPDLPEREEVAEARSRLQDAFPADGVRRWREALGR